MTFPWQVTFSENSPCPGRSAFAVNRLAAAKSSDPDKPLLLDKLLILENALVHDKALLPDNRLCLVGHLHSLPPAAELLI